MRRRPAWIDPLQYWATVSAVIVWLLVLIAWRERPPRAKPASIGATEFSADRAWPVLSYLADTIGYRVAGTPGADSALAYLRRQLAGIRGTELDVQEVSGARPVGGGRVVLGYTVRNLLVRIPGRSPESVLLSAHYDSPPGSVGAGDDGVAAAALVEIVRALAAGPRLAHTVVVNINDAEEQGLLGAHGFTQHPWVRQVRAFVNLESAGPHGKAILFQTGPGNPWLTDAYARAVPYPYGTVIGQDIFQSGAIPSDTDFRIYRDVAGLRGLDIALFQGGWAYHTQRDRTWNVSRGTMQHMGENALALVRVLANGPLPGNVSAERAVYYDVLGAVMVHYTAHTAERLALLALVFGVVVLAVARRRGQLRARDLLLAFLAVLGSVVLALVAALALAAIAAYVARRPMSWFAHPAWAILAFSTGALAAVLVVQRGVGALFRRRGLAPAAQARAALGGVLLFWMLVLAGLTLQGIGSAYVALWWVVGLAVGILAAAFVRDDRWWVGVVLAVLPAGVLTLQLLLLLTRLFVPVFGRLPLPFAPDLVLAMLVGVPAAGVALALVPGAHRAGRVGWTAAVAGGLALAALAASLVQQPYTDRRPQRLAIAHVQEDSTAVLRVTGSDYRTPRRALAGVRGMRPARGEGERPLEFVRPAGPTGLAMPRLDLLSTHAESARGIRTLTLRARADGAFRLSLVAPLARIAGWSLPAPLPSQAERDATLRLTYVAPPDTGIRFSLDVRGDAPIALHLDATRLHTTPDAAALERHLPPWTDVHAVAVNGGWWRF